LAWLKEAVITQRLQRDYRNEPLRTPNIHSTIRCAEWRGALDKAGQVKIGLTYAAADARTAIILRIAYPLAVLLLTTLITMTDENCPSPRRPANH